MDKKFIEANVKWTKELEEKLTALVGHVDRVNETGSDLGAKLAQVVADLAHDCGKDFKRVFEKVNALMQVTNAADLSLARSIEGQGKRLTALERGKDNDRESLRCRCLGLERRVKALENHAKEELIKCHLSQ